MEANAEGQHLDADDEVRAHKTDRIEDAAEDAAAAAPEPIQTWGKSMNSFASSKTEVREN